MIHLVFVYGSLKQGFGNHGMLEGNEFITATRTKGRSYRMVSLKAFPAVLKGGKNAIQGELYAVDATTLALLDMLEGNGQLYQRRQVDLESGHKAWMYCLIPGFSMTNNMFRVLTENRVQTWMMPPDSELEMFTAQSHD